MKRNGNYRPSIEDVIELSDLEILHPGGHALTKRTAEIANLKPNMKVLDVASGKGMLAIYYAKEFGSSVIGVDISEEMIATAIKNAKKAGLSSEVKFQLADSQDLPFKDNEFDVVINECAVGIPDDSQKVLDEMVRVVKPGGTIIIHETAWKGNLSGEKKIELADRFGTTPFEYGEWIEMLRKAGVRDIITEFEQWSKLETFWQMRRNRRVTHPTKLLSTTEKLILIIKILRKFGISGVKKKYTSILSLTGNWVIASIKVQKVMILRDLLFSLEILRAFPIHFYLLHVGREELDLFHKLSRFLQMWVY